MHAPPPHAAAARSLHPCVVEWHLTCLCCSGPGSPSRSLVAGCLQSIMAYNGSGIIAMTGKKCVAIASDMRFGIQQQTLAEDFHKVTPTADTPLPPRRRR